VIYPHLLDLPLTSIGDLAAQDPEIAARLDPSGAWTIAAEAALFARYWRRSSDR
jgi:hypothetical protein